MEGELILLGRGFGFAAGGPPAEAPLLVPLAFPLTAFGVWVGRPNVVDDARAMTGRDEETWKEACEAGRAV